MNALEEHHPNAKRMTEESVTNLGAITGIKRKREEEDIQNEKEN